MNVETGIKLELYVNGAAGNIAPIYSVYPNPKSGHLTKFNILLGDKIIAANRATGGATTEVKLWAGEQWMDTPRKGGLDWTDDLAAYARNNPAGKPIVRLPIRYLTMNDTAIWGAPVELFCEIAIAVRNQSPFAKTFYFGYTNGWIGYLPTKAGFAEGGYEPKTSVFSEQVERDVTEAVIKYLQGIPRN